MGQYQLSLHYFNGKINITFNSLLWGFTKLLDARTQRRHMINLVCGRHDFGRVVSNVHEVSNLYLVHLYVKANEHAELAHTYQKHFGKISNTIYRMTSLSFSGHVIDNAMTTRYMTLCVGSCYVMTTSVTTMHFQRNYIYFKDFKAPFKMPYEPRHEKTGFLHMRKQRRRSVVRLNTCHTRAASSR